MLQINHLEKKWQRVCVVLVAVLFALASAFLIRRHIQRERIRNQKPRVARLTIPTVRTIEDLASRMSRVVDADSAALMEVFADSVLIDSLGYNRQTLPAMFIANTYEVYMWESPKNLLLRLKRESDNFWTSERQVLAEKQNLSSVEVMTLASIVEQETANDAERPTIAGLYLNRLKKGMLLQADPTVKFALGDFALKRVLYRHLEVDNPYNTYKYEGLPPGPICIPSLTSINAVLHPDVHNYYYMCAKEDFSGTHNFATTEREHAANARRYAQALNAAGIR